MKILFLILTGTLLGNQAGGPGIRIRPRIVIYASLTLILLIPLWSQYFFSSRLSTAGMAYRSQGNTAKAEECLRNAVAIDPTNSAGYWGLSVLYHDRYQNSRSREDLEKASSYLRQAVRKKKDVRYIKELEHYQNETQ